MPNLPSTPLVRVPRLARSLCLGLILVGAASAHAAVFNPVTAADFQAALTTASANGQADTINLPATMFATSANGNATFTYPSVPGEAFALTIQGSGFIADLSGDSARRVLDVSMPIGGTVTLRNVIIEHGSISGATGDVEGGGVALRAPGGVTVDDVTLLDNTAVGTGDANVFGAALFVQGAPAIVTDLTVQGNSASVNGTGILRGGAVYLSTLSGTASVARAHFGQNVATLVGGTGFLSGGALGILAGGLIDIEDVSVIEQQVNASNGGNLSDAIVSLQAVGSSGINASRVEIFESTVAETGTGAVGAGALGIYTPDGDVQVEDVSIHDITVTEAGDGQVGSLLNANGETMRVRRSVILRNSLTEADQGTAGSLVAVIGETGGAFMTDSIVALNTVSESGDGDALGTVTFYASDSVALAVHNTVTGNALIEADAGASYGGGMYFGSGSNNEVWNNIIWGNSAEFGADLWIVSFDGVSNVFNNDMASYGHTVGGTFNEGGNLSIVPSFVDAAGSNFHLLGNSPVINQGSPAAPDLQPTDIDGEPRPQQSAPDMGADETLGFNVVEVPTLGGWALIALAATLAGLGALSLRRRVGATTAG